MNCTQGVECPNTTCNGVLIRRQNEPGGEVLDFTCAQCKRVSLPRNRQGTGPLDLEQQANAMLQQGLAAARQAVSSAHARPVQQCACAACLIMPWQADSALMLPLCPALVTTACRHRAPRTCTLHKQPVPVLQGTAAARSVFEELLASFSGKGRLHPSHLVLHDRSAPTNSLPASLTCDEASAMLLTAAMVCCPT